MPGLAESGLRPHRKSGSAVARIEGRAEDQPGFETVQEQRQTGRRARFVRHAVTRPRRAHCQQVAAPALPGCRLVLGDSAGSTWRGGTIGADATCTSQEAPAADDSEEPDSTS